MFEGKVHYPPALARRIIDTVSSKMALSEGTTPFEYFGRGLVLSIVALIVLSCIFMATGCITKRMKARAARARQDEEAAAQEMVEVVKNGKAFKEEYVVFG
jgi:uncharacterized membrane protein